MVIGQTCFYSLFLLEGVKLKLRLWSNYKCMLCLELTSTFNLLTNGTSYFNFLVKMGKS